MLLLDGYYRFCDMCATSGANALIVNISRFLGGEVRLIGKDITKTLSNSV